MTRLPMLKREDLAVGDRRYWDELVAGRGSIGGVFQALMVSPDLAARVSKVGEFTRTNPKIDAAVREIAVLTVDREAACPRHWAAHEPMAVKAGVRPEVIEGLRKGSTAGFKPEEKVIHDFAVEVFHRRLSDATWEGTERYLGQVVAAELAVTIGFTTMMIQLMEAFPG